MSLPLRNLCAAILWLGAVCPANAGMEIIAHRGANSLAPENTLASQRIAYELGVDVVECDVRLSRDLVPIIMHDHSTDRTTGVVGLIGNMTLQEIKQLDAGSWFGPQYAGERVPTLAEMLAVAKQYNRRLLLDMKGEGFANFVVPVIKDSGIPLKQILFLTWWEGMTAEYATRLPGVEILRNPSTVPSGASIRPDLITDADLAEMRRQKVTTFGLMYSVITPYDIQRFHAAGFRVSLVYPSRGAAFSFEDAGLDQFWTDFPETTVPRVRKTSQQWANWADSTALPPDHRRSWQDDDGDGLNNLTEYAFGTNPLLRETAASPVTRFSSGNGTRGPAVTSIEWTLDLREDWSQFLSLSAQSSDGTSRWGDLSSNCCTEITPSQLLFKFPVATSGRTFYRLRFDVKQQ